MNLHELLEQSGGHLDEFSLIGFGVAAVAGVLASAVCPCTLPVGLGVASVSGASESADRRGGLLIATAFFGGTAVSLAVLGAFAGRIGALLSESFGQYWAVGMAVLMALAAAVAFAAPRLKVSRLAELRRPGLAGAFIYGVIFSLGTSVAPLVLLLGVAAAEARPGYGLTLGLSFGLGRGLPFLLLGVFAGALMRLTRLAEWQRGLQIFSGCMLLGLSGYFAWAAAALF